MFIPRRSGYRAGLYVSSVVGDYRHLLTIFFLSVLEIEPGDFSSQYDPSDWKEYFCVLERDPPAIRICLDEQVSKFTASTVVEFDWVWDSFVVDNFGVKFESHTSITYLISWSICSI